MVCNCYPAPGRKTLQHLHSSQYIGIGAAEVKRGTESRTDVVPPILGLRNKTFTEGIRARDLEFVQHSRSGTHVQSLESEGVSAEVVDEIAQPT